MSIFSTGLLYSYHMLVTYSVYKPLSNSPSAYCPVTKLEIPHGHFLSVSIYVALFTESPHRQTTHVDEFKVS